MKARRYIQYVTKSIRQILILVADSAAFAGANSKSDNAAAGGTFNYRTDALDDGTDPAGWYGDD